MFNSRAHIIDNTLTYAAFCWPFVLYLSKVKYKIFQSFPSLFQIVYLKINLYFKSYNFSNYQTPATGFIITGETSIVTDNPSIVDR